MNQRLSLLLAFLISFSGLWAQKDIVAQIEKEATENSQLDILAHELVDVIGPRLVGTPQMAQAHQWAVANFNRWGIQANNRLGVPGAVGNAAFRILI